MALLWVEGVTKRFGGLVANNNVSFAVEEGEILGLIGPNGAGKSTLFEVITGFQRPQRFSRKGHEGPAHGTDLQDPDRLRLHTYRPRNPAGDG